jgi:hypothetical protein
MERAMRVPLFALLTLAAGFAWADPVKVAESKLGTFYVDPSAIRVDGAFRRVWIVETLKLREQRNELSIGSLREYDCKRHRSRALSISTHLELMPTWYLEPSGDEVGGQWNPVEPGAAGTILRFVCAT